LFARPEAGGYDRVGTDALFASAFAQTLIFGLLLARDAGRGAEVGELAYQMLPEGTYPLLRGTLRALTLDEVRAMLGVGFDIARDAVNSVVLDMLSPAGGRDPLLYLYEDFLRVFDPEAAVKYGVYYTPPPVVQLIVAETDRTLREHLGTDGLIDPQVQLLDPACGTGTFLIAAAGAVAERVTVRFGGGAVPAEVSAFAQRMNGFEILVGPYTVAHYRMLREITGLGGNGGHLPIYLADTLAPPAGAAGVTTHLAFMGAPMVAEREAADLVKRTAPILAIFGNPPYRRLRRGEVNRLVGAAMAQRWRDLTDPVRDAGFARSLNAFPDLYIAFYRWALWRLFEADGARGRGVLGFITNRGFLAGRGFGGLRRMLRRRFDLIRIFDLRGDSQGTRPVTINVDENVFNIRVGVAILVAHATGNKPPDAEAEVQYADAWREQAFTRSDKFSLAAAAATDPGRVTYRPVRGQDMDPLKPTGFADVDWPSVAELLTFQSNGIVTYRDEFVYATRREVLTGRIRQWLQLPDDRATRDFGESALNKAGPARRVPFDATAIQQVSYRPLDVRYLYAKPQYVDRLRPLLQEAWGPENFALFAAEDGTGAGPAVWCHCEKPDQHALKGSYGGWVFPLWNHVPGARGHFFAPALIPSLAAAYGRPVAPLDVFDAVLGLLSASSYTTRFAFDLDDDFPHVPFPADPEAFSDAARLGARIRALEGFLAEPAPAFRATRIVGQATGPTLDVPSPARAFTNADGTGTVALLRNQSLRMADVPERVWRFEVSGHLVLYKWLRARNGTPLAGAIGAALLREVLDTTARIAELLFLFDQADAVLENALAAPLTRADLDLPAQNAIVVDDADDAPG
jgi:predicted helicase